MSAAPVLLVGLGFMGRAYAAVLRELSRPVIAIGRSAEGAAGFEKETGIAAQGGGLDAWLRRAEPSPQAAIVCVPVEQTAGTVAALLAAGVHRILVEKPGGRNPQEITELAALARAAGARVSIAYNRRYFASVLEAQRRAEVEGGVTSFHFEFTERERDAMSAKFSPEVQRYWVLANSSHVIDLAFYLGGEPARMATEVGGALDWHPSAAQFAGCGVTTRGALFSYCANWTSGGRWGVELMTRESRLILRPLEQLHVQRRGSFLVDPVELNDDVCVRFKPGLFRQTRAFIEEGDDARLQTLDAQVQRLNVYGAIAGWARLDSAG